MSNLLTQVMVRLAPSIASLTCHGGAKPTWVVCNMTNPQANQFLTAVFKPVSNRSCFFISWKSSLNCKSPLFQIIKKMKNINTFKENWWKWCVNFFICYKVLKFCYCLLCKKILMVLWIDSFFLTCQHLLLNNELI